jgi:TIR domain
MAAKIIICYGHEDRLEARRRVVERLYSEFWHSATFIDGYAMAFETDALHQEVAKVDVMLVVIGPSWTNRDGHGKWPLFGSSDFVRTGIASAFRHNVRVIPLLLNGSTLPPASQLSNDIKELSQLTSFRVSTEMDGVISSLKEIISPESAAKTQTDVCMDIVIASGAEDAQKRWTFVSFSRDDLKYAMEILRDLESSGIRCWISSRDVPSGQDYQEAIVDALDRADSMVLVFSNKANNSDEIAREIALASRHKILILPVRIEDVEPTRALRYQLVTRQYIDLFDDREHKMKLIVQALHRIRHKK